MFKPWCGYLVRFAPEWHPIYWMIWTHTTGKIRHGPSTFACPPMFLRKSLLCNYGSFVMYSRLSHYSSNENQCHYLVYLPSNVYGTFFLMCLLHSLKHFWLLFQQFLKTDNFGGKWFWWDNLYIWILTIMFCDVYFICNKIFSQNICFLEVILTNHFKKWIPFMTSSSYQRLSICTICLCYFGFF